MKRLAAIVFLAVLLFNLCGYRLVFQWLQQQHAATFTAQLDDEEYNNADLISIKTALSLPYYNASMDFERVDGEITIDGVAYQYVKRRIVADSLELLCLPNKGKQHLQTATSNFFKITNDLQHNTTKKGSTIVKTSAPEYCNDLLTFSLQTPPVAPQQHLRFNTFFTTSLFARLPEQPPETTRVCS